MTFDPLSIIAFTIGKEGGYVDNPNDPGGRTNFGITERQARAVGFTGDMRTLQRQEAVNIYYETYWGKPGMPAIAVLSDKVASKLFDAGVNCGPAAAIGWLQRALNAFNRSQRDYRDINEDGEAGPATLEALRRFLAVRGADGETVMLRAVNSQQAAHYLLIAEKNRKLEDFTFGWFLNRIS